MDVGSNSEQWISREIARLRREAVAAHDKGEWEGRRWFLYLTEGAEPWDTVQARFVHEESLFPSSVRHTGRAMPPGHWTHRTRRVGGAEALADLFVGLPLLPLETGLLLLRAVQIHGPEDFTGYCRMEDIGVESYEVRRVRIPDGSERRRLYRVRPRPAPHSPPVRELVAECV